MLNHPLPVGGRATLLQGYDTPLMTEGDYYSVSQAAKVLKVTPGRIRQMLAAGELGSVLKLMSRGRWPRWSASPGS